MILKYSKKTRKHKKNPVLSMQKLKKQKGGRIHDVETFRVTCSSFSKENTSSWLVAKDTIKLPSEAMYDDFVHLIKANMKNTDIIVKMQNPGLMASKELTVLEFFKLHNTPNIVPYICSFTCNDNLTKWSNTVKEMKGFCKGGSEPIQLILLDYITNTITDILQKEVSEDIFQSIIKQLGYIYIHTYMEYGFTHGDIHSGNILVDIDIPKINTYKIQGTTYSVDTKGYEPMLIDFQRGMLKPEMNEEGRILYLQNDLSMLYDMLGKQSNTYKYRLESVAQKIFITDTLDEMIELINTI